MAYDEKCYELANVFLSDEPKLFTSANIEQLAQSIQDVIDATLEEMRAGAMTSDDYKRGVRDMAAAMRENFPGMRWPLIRQIIDEAAQRLIADPVPVPKFTVGSVVRLDHAGTSFGKIADRTFTDRWVYKITGYAMLRDESELHHQTSLEATGKE